MPEYPKTACQDAPDDRDWIYRPPLLQLPPIIDPPENLRILDQGMEGACTGFATAAAINRLYEVAVQDIRVSPRMLYEMAKRHDEWQGEGYEGSSLRGAISGWKNMGTCREELWPYDAQKKGRLTVTRAKDARSHTIGAYYRLRPVVTDYHAALTEASVIVVSANVHGGWENPASGTIKHRKTRDGGHAFAIVGYNDNGFWVQNSWGENWGTHGLAVWTYEDWIENVMDAWVFRLALPTPQIFATRPGSSLLDSEAVERAERPTVARSEIAGHFVHIDDGRYKKQGRYWSSADDVEETARHIAKSTKYQHLLIYVHGGLNSPEASARRIAAMRSTFKANGIYPFHIMYDTGLIEEVKDLITRKESVAVGRVGGISDWTDRIIERLLRRPGTLVWDEMKRDARDAFAARGDGMDALTRFTKHLRRTGAKIKLHLAGHSTGAVVIAHLLHTVSRRTLRFETCSLLAPACSIALYRQTFAPVLDGKTEVEIGDLTIYNLTDEREKDDTVAVYRKSLLYLVSNAFEAERETPLLGMEKFADQVPASRQVPTVHYSTGVETSKARTASRTHGGFDNDPRTMNDILRRVLGGKPSTPFTGEVLDY